MNVKAFILAAGKGTRMKSEKAKCCVEILGKPMILHLYDTLYKLNIEPIVIIGYKQDQVISLLKDNVKYVYQDKQLGTAHACLCAKEILKDFNGITLIIPGDLPLIKEDMIIKLINQHILFNNELTILSTIVDDPYGYGRIKRNTDGKILEIIEQKELTDVDKNIKEVNTGVYAVDNNILFKYLKDIKNDNNSKEYYLTDLIKILVDNNHTVNALCVFNNIELTGINDFNTLYSLEQKMISHNL